MPSVLEMMFTCSEIVRAAIMKRLALGNTLCSIALSTLGTATTRHSFHVDQVRDFHPFMRSIIDSEINAEQSKSITTLSSVVDGLGYSGSLEPNRVLSAFLGLRGTNT